MAMSVSEKIDFYGKMARSQIAGLDIAKSTGDYYLAIDNCGGFFRNFLMQGLISWRLGEDPRSFLADSLSNYLEGLETLKIISGNKKIDIVDLPFSEASFVASLLGKEWYVSELVGISADVLLDGVLSNFLQDGQWDEKGWEKGCKELSKMKKTELAVSTYDCYKQILLGDESSLDAAVQEAEGLYEKRSKNGFYSGGHETAGGGPDNKFVVDFILAALLKFRGIENDSIHSWRW